MNAFAYNFIRLLLDAAPWFLVGAALDAAMQTYLKALRSFITVTTLLVLTTAPAMSATLRQLQEEALRTSPDIASIERHLEATRAAGQQAGRWTNPELSISADRDEQKISITQMFDVWGKLSLARRVGNAQMEAVAARVASSRLELGSEVARQFWTLAAAQRRLALVEAELSDWEKLLRIREGEVTAGEIAAADLIAAQSIIVQRQQDRSKLRSELTTARAALNRMTGRSLDEALEIEVPSGPSLSAAKLGSVRDAIEHALSRHPLLAHVRARLVAAGFRVGQEERHWAPDPKAGPFVRRSDDSTYVGLALSFSLPVLDQNRAGIRAAAADVAAIQAELRAVELMIVQETFTAYELLVQAREVYAESGKLLQASSARQRQIAEESFTAGALSERELLATRIELSQRGQALEAWKAQIGLAEARLARALAEEISGESTWNQSVSKN